MVPPNISDGMFFWMFFWLFRKIPAKAEPHRIKYIIRKQMLHDSFWYNT